MPLAEVPSYKTSDDRGFNDKTSAVAHEITLQLKEMRKACMASSVDVPLHAKIRQMSVIELLRFTSVDLEDILVKVERGLAEAKTAAEAAEKAGTPWQKQKEATADGEESEEAED